MKKPYKWQEEAFKRFKDATCFMLNVCCGGGKTFGAILIALYNKLPIIVIAPKTVCTVWRTELIEDCGIAPDDIFVYSQTEYSKNKARYEEQFTQWLSA